MVFLSSLFMGDIVRNNLVNSAETAISSTETNINTDLKELKTLLDSTAEIVRCLILREYGFDTVAQYITDMTDFALKDEWLKVYSTGFYGFFEVFDNIFYDGTGCVPPDDYIPEGRPWYKTGVEANGEVGITDSYFAMAVGKPTLSFSRRIFDEEGRPLGIVCLDILLDKVRGYAVNTNFNGSGYGLLLSDNMEVLAHPDETQWGNTLANMGIGISDLAGYLEQGKRISERRVKNYKGEASVAFFQQIQNGWYIGFLIPETIYFNEMRNMP